MNDFDTILNRRNTNSIKWKGMTSDDAVAMCLADMDFSVSSAISAALTERVAHDIYGYTGHSVTFHDTITAWVVRRYGLNINPSWISMNQGVVTSLCTIIRALSQPGDKVIIQPPVYRPFFTVVENNQRVVVENTLILADNGKYSIDFDLLAQQAKDAKLLILCNPHNPVGRVWTTEELTLLGNICIANGVTVISDDIHADFTWDSPYIPFASLSADFAQHSITCFSPSKTFNIAGLNISYEIIQNPALREKIRRENIGAGNTHQNLFANIALEEAYTHCDNWLEELLKYLNTSRTIMRDFFADKSGINLIEPEGSYLAWLDCRQLGKTSEELTDKLLSDAHIRMTPGTVFGKTGEGFLRMNYATSHAVLSDCLGRIGEVLM
jgi:cystathionine beta-lyase